jgi:prepilin-type N-terminal cleavage/methylation domain-containing protein
MSHAIWRIHQRGLSLVEMAIAMVITGIAATMSWQAIRSSSVRENLAESRDQIQRAEAALLAYVAVRRRLPCPASQPDGLENCAFNSQDQYFPYRTVGVPEPKMAGLRYVPYNLSALPPPRFPVGVFSVSLNDQPISVTSAPRAARTPLNSVASTTYDGMLDLCEVLSRLGKENMNAFSLEQRPDDDRFMSSLSVTTHATSAAQVSNYLSCGQLASVGGRSQYHAHLASAILNKTLKEYKWIFEADYGTYNWDLAEAAFFMSTKAYGELMRWPKTIQALSKFHESRFTDVGAVITMATSVVNQAASTTAVVAQASNVQRFVANLAAARRRYGVIVDLTKRAEVVYESAWQNAVLSSSSAYFLREQTVSPSLPLPLGVVALEGPNPLAATMINSAKNRAEGFGADIVSSALQPLPSSAEVPDGVSNDFVVDPMLELEAEFRRASDGTAPESGPEPSPDDIFRDQEKKWAEQLDGLKDKLPTSEEIERDPTRKWEEEIDRRLKIERDPTRNWQEEIDRRQKELDSRNAKRAP